MSAAFPLLEETESFRLVRGAGLPVFRWDGAEYATFYAPGYLCVVGLANADWFETTIAPSEQGGEGSELYRRAEMAVAESQRWQEGAFTPECLTLYMNNECNLGCAYCHTDPSPAPATRLELEAIAAAAELVAESCRQKGRPFYAVFHGGGEPVLHRERVKRALALLDKVATAHGVELFRYVATNGVMPEQKARWLARHFDLIGLSCDGPPDIQNSQRPSWDGGATSHAVERSGRILREEGCRFHVRTTITTATLERQAEIADYICHQFSPEEIHFEPVYVSIRTGASTELDASRAGEFVDHFLRARDVAREHGILLMSSGSRLDSIHGPYCHVFRDTLNLVPGGVATACFEAIDTARVEEKGAKIGALDRESGRFEIDQPRVLELQRRLNAAPDRCTDCFNLYHCARECPDRCPLDNESCVPEPGFRCLVQKSLAYATLRETAEQLWAARAGEKVRGTAILRSVFPISPAGN